VKKPRQWYEEPSGRARLAVEMEAVARFNAPRPPELQLRGKRHRLGHLIFTFAFRPLATQGHVVKGELVLSSSYPEVEPIGRIDDPVLATPHVLPGGYARELTGRTIPLDWSREADLRIPCMWRHEPGAVDGWSPAFTVTTAVLNVQSWFLNYLVWSNTGRWPYDGGEVAG
jgi:hypothetical protein